MQNMETKFMFILIKQYTSRRYWRPLMESNSWVNLLITGLLVLFCSGFFKGNLYFSFFSDHATLISDTILIFHFLIIKIRSSFYKLHFINTLFVTFSNLTISFDFKIEQLTDMKTLNWQRVYVLYHIILNSLKRIKIFEYWKSI